MSEEHIARHVYLVTFGVLHVNVNWRGIGHVSDAALLRHDLACDAVLFHDGHADPDVSELEEKLVRGVVRRNPSRQCIARDQGICLDDLFDFDIDEIVE